MSRRFWADYFDKENIQYAFFSAANAMAIQEERREYQRMLDERRTNPEDNSAPDSDTEDTPVPEERIDEVPAANSVQELPSTPLADENAEDEDNQSEAGESEGESSDEDLFFDAEESTEEGQDPRTRVLNVLELEALFQHHAPDLNRTYPKR